MRKNNWYLALCVVSAASCLCSCITTSNELDLDKKISLDMQIGNEGEGPTIPLGNLKKIYIDSLIKTGDASSLVTLGNGMYGFSMNGEIDNIKADGFSVSDIVISEKVQETKLEIPSVDLSTINNSLPSLVTSFITEPVSVTVPSGLNIPEIPITIPEQFVDFNVKYDLPADVARLNKVYFGQDGSDAGQKMTLNVDLTSIYSIISDPKIKINSLEIAFPSNCKISKDAGLDSYIEPGNVIVAGNKININNAVISGIGNDHKLPVSIYLDEIDFSQYGANIDYKDKLSYKLEISISGTSSGNGSNLYINIGMDEKLQMRDFSVDTNGKELNIEEKVIPSSYEVTGLDNILRIDRIDFDESASFIRFSLSDFDIAPFEFTPNSAITVTFPSGFGFDQGDGNVYAGDVAVGQWKDGNKLDIYPGLVKGKEVILRVSSLTLNKTVDQTKKSIEVNNDVAYSANIGVSATNGIDKSALDVLNDKDISFRVSGQLVLKSVTGKVNPEIEGHQEEVKVSLGDDAGFLKDSANHFVLSDPKIVISLVSNVTVPVAIDLGISSVFSDNSKSARITPDAGPIHLPACPATAAEHKKVLVIHKNARPAPASEDTILVRISHLSDLMSTVPDKILFDLNASVDQSEDNHFIDLSREFSVSGSYDVSIPMSFESVYVEYSDKIDNLGKELKDIADKIDAVTMELHANATSTIPLGVRLTAKALDKDGKPVNGITIGQCLIAAGNDPGSSSQVKLEAKVEKGALAKLESIEFTAKCESDDNASKTSLRKGQYLELDKVCLKFPGGVNVDFTENKQ